MTDKFDSTDPRCMIAGRMYIRRELELDMSQEELAKKLGVSVEDIIAWEGGDEHIKCGLIPWTKITKLAEALKTTQEYLLSPDEVADPVETKPKPKPKKKPTPKKAVKTKTTGEAIQEAREAKGWTRRELAEAMGCTYQSIYIWEIGKSPVPAHRLAKIAEVLGVDVEELK